jgi:hypothetical protein
MNFETGEFTLILRVLHVLQGRCTIAVADIAADATND